MLRAVPCRPFLLPPHLRPRSPMKATSFVIAHFRSLLWCCLLLAGPALSLRGADLDPVLVGQWPPQGPATGSQTAVAVAGDYAYVTIFPYGLRVFDVGNRAAPKMVGELRLPGYSWDLAISGHYAYVGTLTGVEVIDVQVPARPKWVSFCGCNVSGITISGDYAYVAAGTEGLLVLDIRDPARPQRLAALPISG
jgi:hypothetical protein